MANSANDFNTAMNELQSLEAYILSLRDYFNKFEEAGKKEDKINYTKWKLKESQDAIVDSILIIVHRLQTTPYNLCRKTLE